MKKILFAAAILAAISFASCSKTCKCTLKDGEIPAELAAQIEKYDAVQCENYGKTLQLANAGDCSMQ